MLDEGVSLLGPGWEVSEGLAVRGRAFDSTGDEARLPELFGGVSSHGSVIKAASQLSGFFSVVRETTDAVYLACDSARSIPLYFTDSPPVQVSDSPGRAMGREPTSEFDPVVESEFVLTRYVTRGETLLPDVKSVRAGEVVRIPRDEPASFDRRRHSRYRPSARVDGDLAAYLDEMRTVLAAVFDRAAAVIGNRPALVPLSGGIDSRLVATMLRDRGCEVIAFTFGRRGHSDVETSRDVASALGIDWVWVEYSPERWHEWYHTSDRQAYHEFAFSYDALPFLAEWPAVSELRSADRLPSDGVVCPGHTIATPSERVPRRWIDTAPGDAEVIDHILEHHYDLWDWHDPKAREVFADRITAEASPGPVESGPAAAAAYEHWEWATRMTTFTTGDLRLYDWFDLDWWLPLWDPEFVTFWASVPLRLRHGKTLQTAFTERKYAEVAGVDRSTAQRTDDDWTPLDQIRRTFQTDPLATIHGNFGSWLGAQAQPRSRWETWGNYPLGWYGIIREEHADQFAAAKNLYGLRTLEAVGKLSFDPPHVADPPLTREIELPLLGEAHDP